MQKHSPKISVIVPIYNVSEFLDECIISIIEQTYTNLEIILVDDGSTDDCGIKCDQFACSDKRIIVIHKKNGGLSDARNSALDICTGEYLTFIDSDDAVSNDYISVLYSTIKATNTEISVCAYNESIKTVFEQPTSTFIKRFTQQYTIKSILQESIISTSAWGKLYKSHLFNDVRFPYGQIFEDLSTIWKVFDKVEAISYNSHIGYFYRINPNSITNKSFSKKNLDFIPAHLSILNYVAKRHPKLLKYGRRRFCRYANAYLYRAIVQNYEDEESLQLMRKIISKYYWTFLFSNYSISKKLFATLSITNFKFLTKFFK